MKKLSERLLEVQLILEDYQDKNVPMDWRDTSEFISVINEARQLMKRIEKGEE